MNLGQGLAKIGNTHAVRLGKKIVELIIEPEKQLVSAMTGAKILVALKNEALKGDVSAQLSLGRMYFRGDGVAQDTTEAVTWYRKAAATGYGAVQEFLGTLYDNGDGVPQNYAEAVTWYRQAANQGYIGAQYGLAVMYEKGNGVPPDDVAAYKWLILATSKPKTKFYAVALHAMAILAKRMTLDDIARAGREASVWTARS